MVIPKYAHLTSNKLEHIHMILKIQLIYYSISIIDDQHLQWTNWSSIIINYQPITTAVAIFSCYFYSNKYFYIRICLQIIFLTKGEAELNVLIPKWSQKMMLNWICRFLSDIWMPNSTESHDCKTCSYSFSSSGVKLNWMWRFLSEVRDWSWN